ncbi:patatin-like phospholipase family protein [Flavobacterium sp. HXWNR69]|uniref:Patatin-like phospholipase family protein n=1 Tax=Flavobacterium fragile TaxID=2949085 RepID=A0ABT0TFD1_9FLAO|nr:patatin-like phospholipase family protein [Flavobacterium sp. HXWNR69]MCL9769678.1 patatin-like phospholipase family protein [Flavobacterium sp. HXWNR69]
MEKASKSIGVVLSGGGSKGIAHAGALQFLTEKGMQPSCIAGTSAGAIVGGLFAFGKTPEEILEFFKSIYFFHWKHFTFKKAGLIDSESFKSYFVEVLGDIKLGELTIPAYITATDLVTGKLKIFNSETKLTDAILASSSFPGMLSPYEINKNLYSDGGILNHFPADILQGRCDYLIGVYVSPIQNIESKDLKSIKSVTSRAFDLLYANYNYQKFNLCDWVIEPKELANYSTFETSKTKMDTIFEIGYNEAKKSFEELNL